MKLRHHAAALILILASAPHGGGAAAASAAPPPPRLAEHVIVVMLDGCRPDILRRANAPVLHALAAAGTTFIRARTIYPSQTRVAFVSLPTGAYPGSHGIVGGNEVKDAEWRTVAMGDDDPIATQALVARPTFFEAATAAGLTSLYAAMKGYELVGARGATWTINGKKTLNEAAYKTRYEATAEGSADLAAGYKQSLSRQLLAQTLEILREKRPSLVVVNLGSVDYAGHSFGPEGTRYREAIEFLDGLVGDLLKALDAMGIRERTTIIVSADHGFSDVDATRVVAPATEAGGHRLAILASRGIEHYLSNTGGASMGLYVRDKTRMAEAVAALRAEPWCEAVYCEDPKARCDLSLRSLHDYFPGRSPDVMVDLDDDAALNYPQAGQHGSLRHDDMAIPLILSGAGVASGRVEGEARLVDVAPTVLRLLGLPPEGLRPDGRVLEEALRR
jgi:predicted AlkP superfamily pyrophosphatase or phosphodiesterase